MHALDSGKIKCVTSNRLSNDPLYSQSMFSMRDGIRCLSFLTSFFMWHKTMTSSTFAFKNKSSQLLNRAEDMKMNLTGLTLLTLI
jgi:hypothetical protein